MHRLLVGITADDLTGTAGAAAAFARPGAAAAISLDLRPPAARDERLVFGVTTTTRSLPPDEVFDLVADSVGQLRMAGATFVFKKLDSNLRGNLGAELAAVFDTMGGPVVFAPAFPARGRTTVEATVFAGGFPVAETEMARDPEAPVRHSHVPTLLAEQWPQLYVATCPLAIVREGASAIRRHLRPEGLVVADAETEADLDALAEAVLLDPPLSVAAGSGGLAAALARRFYGPPAAMVLPRRKRGPALAILASASQSLAAQVAHAAAISEIAVVPFACERLNWEEQPVPVINAASAAAVAALKEGRDVVVHTSGGMPNVERPVDLVVEHLAHVALLAVQQGAPRALLIGGGAMAREALGALGVRALEIDDQPRPGIAAGIISGGLLANHPIVLKPGAAGDPDALVDLLHYLGQRAAALERA